MQFMSQIKFKILTPHADDVFFGVIVARFDSDLLKNRKNEA